MELTCTMVAVVSGMGMGAAITLVRNAKAKVAAIEDDCWNFIIQYKDKVGWKKRTDKVVQRQSLYTYIGPVIQSSVLIVPGSLGQEEITSTRDLITMPILKGSSHQMEFVL